MSRNKISVFGSSTGEEELEQLRDVLTSEWLGNGVKTKQFESEFQIRLDLPNFLMVNSGSSALHMACVLLDLPKGSEVILPTITWLSCAHAVILAGLKPVFCDVDLYTQNVTVETIIPHITKNTRAIMVVHYAGKPVDILPILDLGYPVIEDAAHAVDSSIDGKACGSFGEVGIYSFDSIKNIAAGEAGGLTCKTEKMFKRAEALRYSGIGHSGFEQSKTLKKWWEYNILEVFPKYMPNDLTSAVALAQLHKLDKLQNRRKEIWERYQAGLSKIKTLVLPTDVSVIEKHSYFTYFLQVENRDVFARKMLENGIYTTFRYHPLHLNSIFEQNNKYLPMSEVLNSKGINIPLHPKLSDKDIDYIINTIASIVL
jgi:dTDP-4-amino-4,6-dideoxygalactose transaminase